MAAVIAAEEDDVLQKSNSKEVDDVAVAVAVAVAVGFECNCSFFCHSKKFPFSMDEYQIGRNINRTKNSEMEMKGKLKNQKKSL